MCRILYKTQCDSETTEDFHQGLVRTLRKQNFWKRQTCPNSWRTDRVARMCPDLEIWHLQSQEGTSSSEESLCSFCNLALRQAEWGPLKQRERQLEAMGFNVTRTGEGTPLDSLVLTRNERPSTVPPHLRDISERHLRILTGGYFTLSNLKTIARPRRPPPQQLEQHANTGDLPSEEISPRILDAVIQGIMSISEETKQLVEQAEMKERSARLQLELTHHRKMIAYHSVEREALREFIDIYSQRAERAEREREESEIMETLIRAASAQGERQGSGTPSDPNSIGPTERNGGDEPVKEGDFPDEESHDN